MVKNDIRICDFGLAVQFTKGDMIRGCVGKRSYYAPEVYEGKHYEPSKADVWSCAAIAYAILFSGTWWT